MFGGKYKTRDIISLIESSFLWKKKKRKESQYSLSLLRPESFTELMPNRVKELAT